MNKFNINNIYNDNGNYLNEIINKFLFNFLDNELDFNDIIKWDANFNN